MGEGWADYYGCLAPSACIQLCEQDVVIPISQDPRSQDLMSADSNSCQPEPCAAAYCGFNAAGQQALISVLCAAASWLLARPQVLQEKIDEVESENIRMEFEGIIPPRPANAPPVTAPPPGASFLMCDV